VKGLISAYTEYELDVKKPTELGFTSSEQSIFITEFQNLILALNLTLRRVCITGENPLIAQGGINLKPPGSRVSIQKNGSHTTVNIEDTVAVRDEVHATVGLSEKIACLEATQIFQKLQSLDRFNHSKAKSLGVSNFFKALKEYEDGMLARDRASKFKNIFNALELAVTIDGINRKDSVFDQQVSNLSGMNNNDVKDWRGLYNRTKHADRDPKDMNTYLKGIEELGGKYIIPVRSCCTKILVDSLLYRV
jgi:hypothetical protein